MNCSYLYYSSLFSLIDLCLALVKLKITLICSPLGKFESKITEGRLLFEQIRYSYDGNVQILALG